MFAMFVQTQLTSHPSSQPQLSRQRQWTTQANNSQHRSAANKGCSSSRGSRRDASQAPWYVFFSLFYFTYYNIYLDYEYGIHKGPTRTHDSWLRQQWPTMANAGQHNSWHGQQRPMLANEGPQHPTQANTGPKNPTQANKGQQGLMWDNKDPWWDDGHRYVLILFIYSLY